MRISDDFAQRTGRYIRSHWHEHDSVARRVRYLAAPPRPQPANGAKQQSFFFAIFTSDQNTFLGVDCRMGLAQRNTACRRGDAKIVDLYRWIFRLGEFDAARRLAEVIHPQDRFSEPGHTQKRRPPVCEVGEIVHEPSKSRLHLVEGADNHHQFAEAYVAPEVSWSRDEYRRDDRKPAVAGGNPGQSRHGSDDPP